ncbi:hypothetical protein A7X92_03815 [Stenotrophomonas maltophilia]|nr:hypothetical protein A7X92_03815 [Stenotrophomonas maltophilia]
MEETNQESEPFKISIRKKVPSVPPAAPFHDIGGKCLIRLSQLLYAGEIQESQDGKSHVFLVVFIGGDVTQIIGKESELIELRAALAEAANAFALSQL